MKRVIALVISLVIMGIIFSRIEVGEFKKYVQEMDLRLFVLAVLFFIPQVLVTAYRWKVMVRKKVRIELWEATKLILTGNALNILVPSRAGDLAKGYFLSREGNLDLKRGMNLVIFEKYIDLASLGIVILTGILWSRSWDMVDVAGAAYSLGMIGAFPLLCLLRLDRWIGPEPTKAGVLGKIKGFVLDTGEYLNEIKGNPGLLAFIVGLSVFLWFLHILQFYMIFLALKSGISVGNVFRLVPLAILIGLVPITMAGIGTRDSAMIFLFAPYEKVSLVAGVGLFASFRYFVPGILGLPFLNQYIVKGKPE